jgi:hypothetical protein
MKPGEKQIIRGLKKLEKAIPDGCLISYADWYLQLKAETEDSKSIRALELLGEYALGGDPIARVKKENKADRKLAKRRKFETVETG